MGWIETMTFSEIVNLIFNIHSVPDSMTESIYMIWEKLTVNVCIFKFQEIPKSLEILKP